jgi:catechol 2,3-dioxygenase-like lactoylglutathione lyase family enzyme
VRDIERSLPFYEALGFALVRKHRKGRWAELCLGDAKLSLHHMEYLPENSEQRRVDLAMESQEPLDVL